MCVFCSPFPSRMQLLGIPVSVPGFALKAVLLTAPTVDPRLPHFAQFLCNVSPFRINTSRTVSKQTALTPFRMNTYEKSVGWGEGAFPPSSNRSCSTGQETQLLSLYTVAHSLAVFLHQLKTQPFYFQAIPHSFAKTHGVGCPSAKCSPQPAFAPAYLALQILRFQSTLSFPL